METINFKLLNGFIIEEHSFLPFDCLIEPFGIKKKYSYEFNASRINPLGPSLCNGFVLIFKFSFIFMHMQMRSFPYRTMGCKNLSNCITDYIKTCNNGGVMMF